MKTTTFLVMLAAASLLSACTRMKISSEYEHSYDFNGIQTYQWVDAPADIQNAEDTYLNTDMQKALNNQLAAQGWKQVLDSSNATIQVTYYFKLRAHPEYTDTASDRENDFSGGLVFNGKNRKWDYEERKPDLNVYTVEVGTLTVTMADVTTGNCIWHGTVQTKIDRSLPDEKLKEQFRQIARKLMENFPRKR